MYFLNAAKLSIPSKLVTMRPNGVPWLRGNIRTLKRQRKRFHKHAKVFQNMPGHYSEINVTK
jgi:hypothetical protein